jgi:hypothetical protein
MNKTQRGKSGKTSKPASPKRKSAVRNLDLRKADQVKGGWTKGGGASVG